MQPPVLPANEIQRQLALDSYHIPYHLPEKEYDDLTFIAASVCETPIAFISFIENDRQYFKSVMGAQMQQMHRNYSFCGHTINTSNHFMEVPDAAADQRFRDSPLVNYDPHIKYYAGCTVVNQDGFALGTICVADHKERHLDSGQKELLKRLSVMVLQLLELRKKDYLITKSNQKLEQYVQQMKDFAHIASHDLKEPLRMIYSFSSLLEKNYSTLLDERGKKFIYYTHDGARRITKLMDELLSYALMGYDEPPFETIDLNNLMLEIVKLQEAYLDDKGAIVTYPGLPVIKGCKPLLTSLFQNLIVNGVKYAHESRPPVITINYTENAAYWHFSIEDNGIGIPESYQRSIFTPFNRLNGGPSLNGWGLGLAICKNIVERHGGSIWVESEEGRGSKFEFTLKKVKRTNPGNN